MNYIFIFQLYELSDDQKRKEFLDELFAFMQKRGRLFQNFNTIYLMTHQVLPQIYRIYIPYQVNNYQLTLCHGKVS